MTSHHQNHKNSFLADHHFVHSQRYRKRLSDIAFILGFALIGVLMVVISTAQVTRRYAVIEIENGTPSGSGLVAIVNDQSASGGKYVVFNQPVASTPGSPPAPTQPAVPTLVNPPTPPPTSPSGQAMPVGDLPGWRQIFTDDFTTNVPLGSFPAAVSSKWGAYPYPWRDTRGQRSSDPTVGGWYHPGKTVSISNGMMELWLHTEQLDGAKKRLVAAPTPKINGATATGPNGVDGQLYGRYAVRFRLDQSRSVNNAIGYKTAWLLWPKSGVWPRDGEIDFPEGNLNGTISGFMHRQGATSGSDQDYALTTKTYTDWRTAVIEWGPDKTSFLLDGALITNASGGKSEWTSRIPNTPMRYVLQSETTLDGPVTPENSEARIQIDWIAIYQKI